MTVPLLGDTLKLFKVLLAHSIPSQSAVDNGWIEGWMCMHSVILRDCARCYWYSQPHHADICQTPVCGYLYVLSKG